MSYEIGQGYRGVYPKSPLSEDQQHQTGDEVEVSKGVYVKVNNSTPYEFYGLVCRVPEVKAAVVNRATKMELPKRENKAAVKPKKEDSK